MIDAILLMFVTATIWWYSSWSFSVTRPSVKNSLPLGFCYLSCYQTSLSQSVSFDHEPRPSGDESSADLAGLNPISGCCVFFHLWGTAGQWDSHVPWTLLALSVTRTWWNTIRNSLPGIVGQLSIGICWLGSVCVQPPTPGVLFELCLFISEVFLINFNII